MVNQQNSRFDSRRLIDNREVRIFLSSTFSDMQQERTALLKTFDTLKIEANRRNITLSVVDLRWGVTEEESRSGKVLSVCLEEIEHSHPFFIGLLGSRYGTSPDRSEIEKNPELKERYPWIQEDIDNELSITEMEMQYGVLRNDKDVDALFLIKNTPNTLSDDNVRLTCLKNQILDQSRFPTCDYTSLGDLCQKVETAVLSILDKHFPQTENNRLEHERTNQKAFINSRHGHYRKLSADFKRLDDFLNGDEIHLVITGPSGMGKSALIANWLKEKEVTQNSYNIIYHFVGNSFSGSDHRQILQHICDELYNRYSIKRYEGLNETLEDEAQRVLIEAGRKGKPVVLVIDGINQIADHDHSKLLNWLPQSSHTTKYLFSTLEEDETMKSFERRCYPVHKIGTLDRESRREFIISYLQNVGKKLSGGQINRILDDPENENMLVLKTLLDELICFGSYEQLDQRIDFYLSASSVNDFFNRMLQRMEEDYEEVPRILSLIALSENGMTEDELQAVTKLRPLDVHLFYCAFYNHMITRDGLITFGHQYVSDAVWRRYGLNDQETARPYRQQIIDHISKNNSVTRNRKISELAFQYYHIGNDELLYKTILSFEAFSYFHGSDQGDAKLAKYWRKLLADDPEKYKLRNYLDLPFEGIPINRLPYPIIENFVNTYFGDNKTALMYSQTFLFMSADKEGNNSLTMADAYNDIGMVYHDQGEYNKAFEYYSKALEIRERVLGNDHPSTAVSYNNIGAVYNNQGNYSQALKCHFKALEINQIIFGIDHPWTATYYENIGMVYENLGDYRKALKFDFKAQEIKERILGIDHPSTASSYEGIGITYLYQGDCTKGLEYLFKALEIKEKILALDHPSIATTYNNIGGGYRNQGNNSEALECHFKALEIQEKVLGSNHPSTALTYKDIGLVFCNLCDYPKALEYCLKASEVFENILGQDHPLTAMSYNSIGSVYYDKGDDLKAIEYHLKALEINEKVLGLNHPSTATTYSNIATAYYDQGNCAKALEYYFKALAIREKILGLDHPSTAKTYSDIATAYYDQGNCVKAIEYHLKALEINEKVLGLNNPSTATTYSNIATAYYDQGNCAKALEYYFKALAIREKILESDHPSTATTYSNIATTYYDQGDCAKALEYYFKALVIREKVLDPDHLSTATTYNNIGVVYNEQGDYAKALEYFLKALEIREKVLGPNAPKTKSTRDNLDDVREKMDGGK